MHLDEISSPEDIKGMSQDELEALAGEIRQRIIHTVSQNGGHLASNLGTVELTIALHRAFDFSRDKLIFDVGHQSYTHKLLTGREKQFDTLRQFGGMAGFPRHEESQYDAFDTGHASTAISAAVGFARARNLRGETHYVVSVVGDGALTGGMCYEGLNDAGSNQLRMIVVLNDNGMSISRNVGAISGYLTRMRAGKGWFDIKKTISDFLKRVPLVGDMLYRIFHRFKNSIRNIFVQDRLFDSLDFHYLGPVDGSDIGGLERLFRKAKQLDEPVLIHVVTQKGSGYAQAEDHPSRLHGTPPFNVETGEPLSRGAASMSETAGDELIRLAKADSRVVAVTAAMTAGTGLLRYARELPERLFDVGIAEEHAVTMAAGLASGGMRPFVAIYDTFLQRAYDQILHDVCLQKLPVCFLLDRAGLSEDGVTHHGIYGVSYLSQLPGMTVLCASSRSELRAMMHFALQSDGPVAIRYAKADCSGAEDKTEIGAYRMRWNRCRNGDDAAILACGAMLHETLKAAEILEKQGMRCAVYNASCLSPLDAETLNNIRIPLITVEEGALRGGLGSLVSLFCAQNGLPAPVLALGLEGICATQGNHDKQLEAYGLDAASIARSILTWREKQ
ncbi:MAG: 1-deoxy-D-xylulose-5-phosphate synthase [Clostridia bacterium]|nr:1-deoxy-D-xylulose-5-phosphate synthase [Clostridia bacterium]